MPDRPFTRHYEWKFKPRKSSFTEPATINGKPAWQVVAERKKERAG